MEALPSQSEFQVPKGCHSIRPQTSLIRLAPLVTYCSVWCCFSDETETLTQNFMTIAPKLQVFGMEPMSVLTPRGEVEVSLCLGLFKKVPNLTSSTTADPTRPSRHADTLVLPRIEGCEVVRQSADSPRHRHFCDTNGQLGETNGDIDSLRAVTSYVVSVLMNGQIVMTLVKTTNDWLCFSTSSIVWVNTCLRMDCLELEGRALTDLILRRVWMRSEKKIVWHV